SLRALKRQIPGKGGLQAWAPPRAIAYSGRRDGHQLSYTFSQSAGCCNHLATTPLVVAKTQKNCGANRDRTGDLLNAIQALSQLSYSPSATLLYRARFVFAHSKSGRPVSIADFTVQKRALYFLDASLVRVVSAFAPMRRSGTKGDPRLHR